MTEPTPLFPRANRRRPAATVAARLANSAALAAALASLVALILASGEPEPQHPEWASVTRALESDAWPLVRAARYDPANHFVLVDVRSGVAPHVAVLMACEDIRPLIDAVDSSAGFALYELPDRVMAHRDDCAS